ncbi:MAG TPA: anthranilate phosphoribosyltransferase [Candidatus Binataceae bacterium]|nr:anthranilate phosphoribosyltransferase [Candidatus Binataceae bacterium]
MSELRIAFDTVLAGRSLEADAAERAFAEILDGGAAAPDAMVAGFLIALKLKGESAGELAGAARAMRARARRLELADDPNLIDVVGAGGDGAGTFNISTGAALVAAAAGVAVAKHGNRAITGSVGAADLLEYLGVNLDPGPDALRRCVREAGICFILAPAYHPVMARLAALRRALGTATIFNLLGPLSNPAQPARMLLGVGDRKLLRPMAEAIAALGAAHAIVVSGADGMDEISLCAPTHVAEVRAGRPIAEYRIAPEDFGLARAPIDKLRASGAAQSAAMLRAALSGHNDAARDVLALNAGAVIHAGGAADSIFQGVSAALGVIESGRALATIDKLVRASRGN